MAERSETQSAKRRFASKFKIYGILTRSYASRFLLRFAHPFFAKFKLTTNWSHSPHGLSLTFFLRRIFLRSGICGKVIFSSRKCKIHRFPFPFYLETWFSEHGPILLSHLRDRTHFRSDGREPVIDFLFFLILSYIFLSLILTPAVEVSNKFVSSILRKMMSVAKLKTRSEASL